MRPLHLKIAARSAKCDYVRVAFEYSHIASTSGRNKALVSDRLQLCHKICLESAPATRRYGKPVKFFNNTQHICCSCKERDVDNTASCVPVCVFFVWLERVSEDIKNSCSIRTVGLLAQRICCRP